MINEEIILRIKTDTIRNILYSCSQGEKVKNKSSLTNEKIKITDILVDPAIETLAKEILVLEKTIDMFNKKLEGKNK